MKLNQEFYTLKEIAEIFGVHPAVLHTWLKRGLKSMKHGKKRLIKRQWLQDWLNTESKRAKETYKRKIENLRKFAGKYSKGRRKHQHNKQN